MKTTPWTAETLEDAIDAHARTAARLLVSSTEARGQVRDQLLAGAVSEARASRRLQDVADQRAASRWRGLVRRAA